MTRARRGGSAIGNDAIEFLFDRRDQMHMRRGIPWGATMRSSPMLTLAATTDLAPIERFLPIQVGAPRADEVMGENERVRSNASEIADMHAFRVGLVEFGAHGDAHILAEVHAPYGAKIGPFP